MDKATRDKIHRDGSVNLAKLLPRNKYRDENSHKMELLSKDGASFYVPIKMSNKDADGTINSFREWQRAFRVCAGIDSKQSPHRTWELTDGLI